MVLFLLRLLSQKTFPTFLQESFSFIKSLHLHAASLKVMNRLVMLLLCFIFFIFIEQTLGHERFLGIPFHRRNISSQCSKTCPTFMIMAGEIQVQQLRFFFDWWYLTEHVLRLHLLLGQGVGRSVVIHLLMHTIWLRWVVCLRMDLIRLYRGRRHRLLHKTRLSMLILRGELFTWSI
jgi:hypothetical protein